MTKPNVQDLLKKINYIEADIEIQKQILFSIPSDQKAEMEKTIGIISEKKKEIDQLRLQIKEIDPIEYERILTFEEAINQFKKIASETEFQAIEHKNMEQECSLKLVEKSPLPCLIKACDKDGHWTVITADGQIQQFTKDQVSEEPKAQTQ